ncbi:unnamed protein product, partial [Prorocentrum cordatum]
MRSSESRNEMDAGSLSEPVMFRNLFLEWLRGLRLDEGGAGSAPKLASAGSVQRHVFVKHSSSFQQRYAVMPKRLTQLHRPAVVDVAQRTLEFLEVNDGSDGVVRSPARARLEALLKRLGVMPQMPRQKAAEGEAPRPPTVSAEASLTAATRSTPMPLEELFCQDHLVLVTAVVAAFAPLYAHGILRGVEHSCGVPGPPIEYRAPAALDHGAGAAEPAAVQVRQAPAVVVPAEPQYARLQSMVLREAEELGNPRDCFCVPQ